MVTTNNRKRGRPRRFDPDEAVAVATRLFHSRGFDAVGVADLTRELGINPPSFYAAFASKNGLYSQVLDHYAATSSIVGPELLRPERPVAICLAAVLEEAARRYASDGETAGCLVLEGTRCNDPEAREAARAFHASAERLVHDFVAERHPEEAQRVTDFVSTTMVGLSAKARSGQSVERLVATARMAGQAIAQILPAEPSKLV